MKTLPNYHVLLIRHFWDKRNERVAVKIKSERFEQSIIIPYTNEPDQYTSPITEAYKYLTAKGFDIIGQGELKNDYILISKTFEPLKPVKQ